MAIGARDSGTWYRTKDSAVERVPDGVSWFDDDGFHATKVPGL
jgi:hypothetical protein